LDGNTPGKFVKDDIEKLQPLVNAATIALENARLFEEVRKDVLLVEALPLIHPRG
ncbi:unnamed protein product, partial [marine sediment metagenome]